VLGLAPNAARIAIRLWVVGTVAEISLRTKQYFDELAIAHTTKDTPYLPLFRILVNIAVQSKSENIPPNLAGDVMRSILSGRPYPFTLLSAAVRRCRSEQHVKYPRAAIIKAYLNRYSQKEEITVSLDRNNSNAAYRLGRLFAVLEKIQEEANPGINATILDRYYGAASANPVSVFATLLKLKNHHLAKLDNPGRKTNFEKLLGEIFSELPADLPSNLSLQDQGRFAVGYYHQRQDFFTKRDSHDEGEQE
jgi:CRISPR-associated protein Csd1